ncbi:MAG: sensor histidine kinase [Acidobacteria bacterium]|nr:sensor histidine kinase [Acidobacteriota bacterium]
MPVVIPDGMTSGTGRRPIAPLHWVPSDMPDAPTSLTTLRIAGLLGWGAAGLPLIRLLVGPPAEGSATLLLLGSAVLLAFGAAFFAATAGRGARHSRGASVALLAVQTAAALLFVFLVDSAVAGILLVVVTAQLPFCLSPRAALLWCAGQNVVYAVILVAKSGALNGGAVLAAFLAFQLFAFYTVSIAEREARQRSDLTRLNAELVAAQKLLQESSRAAERLRISRDLHDALGHHLAALSLQLEVAGQVAEGKAREPVEKARSVARILLADVRTVVGRFREDDRVNLGDALQLLASDIPRPRIHLDLPEEGLAADPAATTTLLRSVQEIVTNAVKHSGAENLWIAVTRTPEGLEVLARDDGAGASRIEGGRGLAGLAERISEAHGSFDVETSPGRGFRVAIRIPCGPGGGS